MKFGFEAETASVRRDGDHSIDVGIALTPVVNDKLPPKVPITGECPMCHGPLYTRPALGRVIGVIERYEAGGAAVYVDPKPANMEAVVCSNCRVCYWRPTTQ